MGKSLPKGSARSRCSFPGHPGQIVPGTSLTSSPTPPPRVVLGGRGLDARLAMAKPRLIIRSIARTEYRAVLTIAVVAMMYKREDESNC